jgi:hypothetical protein
MGSGPIPIDTACGDPHNETRKENGAQRLADFAQAALCAPARLTDATQSPSTTRQKSMHRGTSIIGERLMIDRRSLVGGMAAASSLGWKARAGEADGSDKGLFWRLEIPDKGTAVVFGTWAIAASLVPGIIRDAYVFIELTRRTIVAYPEFHLKFNIDKKDDKKLVDIVSPRLANEVRVIAEAAGFRGQFENGHLDLEHDPLSERHLVHALADVE